MSALSEIEGIGLGTAEFAFKDGSFAQSVATVHAALDAGVHLIDTALAYTRVGVESYAEGVVRAALAGVAEPDRPLVATKGGHFRRGDEFPIDGSPAALRRDCEISLRALGVDRIDLYQLHHVDPQVPLADSVGALEELRWEGKIAAIGLSNVSLEQLDHARAVATIDSVQNRLSLGVPVDLLTVAGCAERGVRYLAYAPLGGGEAVVPPEVERIAAAHGASTQRIRLAWLCARSEALIPLVGASRPVSIADSAQPVALTPADLAAITACAYRATA